ncbi:MAG: hypothetical protein ACM3TR_15270 [Caulobacteraceae bacterium]
MDKNLVICDVICKILKRIKEGDIPESREIEATMEEFVTIIEAMLRKELIRDAFIIKAADGRKSVLLTNAAITFHGEVLLREECRKCEG